MKYRPYPKYKDSSVEWLGEVPEHWITLPIKYSSRLYNGATPKSGEEEYWGGSIFWVTPADLSNLPTPFITSSARTITQKGYKSCGTTLVPENSIIISSRAPIGNIGITTKETCTNQGCKSLIAYSRTNSTFLYYALLTNKERLNIIGKGTTFLELSADELGAFKLTFPIFSEQIAIANFLDRETTKIDTLIAKQQELIKLLQEKRQAVISHAVTKGLNPDVPMKDSGVEWLGEVPEHWEIPKLSYVGRVLNGSTPDKNNPSYWRNGSIPWLASSCLNTEVVSQPTMNISTLAYKRCSVELIPKGSVLVGMVGQGKTRGTSGLLKIDSCINQNMAAIIPSKNIFSRYLLCVLQTMYADLRELGRGGNQAALNCQIISGLRVPLPTLKEQVKIVQSIKLQVKRIDATFSFANKQISLLQERRTALISAAVTGEIDVRSWNREGTIPKKQSAVNQVRG